jgi:hypothetical protein
MQRYRFLSAALFVLAAVLMLVVSGCFNSSSNNGTATDSTSVVTPAPAVESVVATTSGTESAYYAILDIKVKNKGAEGTILVVASVTQSGRTVQNEMPVYLSQGETHELKLTFPLVWKGGEWKSSVHTQIP